MSAQADDTPQGLWRHLGPGLVVAATGVGAGDLVATLIAGSRFGYALLWAAVLGCIVKIALSEGSARYHLATGSTILAGWQKLGRWTGWYFGVYVVIWGFIYGATAMSVTALPLAAMFPVLPLKAWAVLVGLAGFGFVWLGSYARLETAVKILVAVMFVVIVGLAIFVAPDLGNVLSGLALRLPEGSVIYTLGLIGGVGGTVTTAAYGYWIQAKGWNGPQWIGLMRFDNVVAYVLTGLFVIAMLIVGAELLYAAQIALQGGARGLIDLADVLRDRFGPVIAMAFLVGFAATAFSSVLGVWHGMSLFFADWYHQFFNRPRPTESLERGRAFRAYAALLTFPSMSLLIFDEPFVLAVAYGAFGALFMPFLAITLLLLLNRKDFPEEHRNGWLANVTLAGSALLFLVLAGQQMMSLTDQF